MRAASLFASTESQRADPVGPRVTGASLGEASSEPLRERWNMMNRREAIAVFQAAGLEVWQQHQDELSVMAEQTGTMMMPNVDPAYAKFLRKSVKQGRTIEDSVRGTMIPWATTTRRDGTHPLFAIMGYEQALFTVQELAVSKYHEREAVERVVDKMSTLMPFLLGLE